MKVLSLLLIFSSAVFASFNDYECEFSYDASHYFIEVENSFGGGTSRMITITDTSVNESQTYFASGRYSSNPREVRFFGAGLDLKIRFWPDVKPRYGSYYHADFQSVDVENGRYFFNILCQYTGY